MEGLDLFCNPNEGRGFAVVEVADLLASIPPVETAAVPDEGRLVERSSNPLRELAFDLAELVAAAGGGLVSLFKFFPNFFFVVVSCCCRSGGGGGDLCAELILYL